MFHKSFLKIMTPEGSSPQPHTSSPHPSPFNSEVSPLKPRAHLSVLLSHSPPNPQVVPVPNTHVLSDLERPAVGATPFLPPLEFHLAI